MLLSLLLLKTLVLGQSASTETNTLITSLTETSTVPVLVSRTSSTTRSSTAMRSSISRTISSTSTLQRTTEVSSVRTSSSRTNNPSSDQESNDSNSSSLGLFIGLGVAAVVAVALLALAFMCIRRQKDAALEPLDFNNHSPSKKAELVSPVARHTTPVLDYYSRPQVQVYQGEYQQGLPSGYSVQTEYYPNQGYTQEYDYPQAYQQYPVEAYNYDQSKTPPPKAASSVGVDSVIALEQAGQGQEFYANNQQAYFTNEQQNYGQEFYGNGQGYYEKSYSDGVKQENANSASPPKELERGVSVISDATKMSKDAVIPPLPDMRFAEVEQAEFYQEYTTSGRTDLDK
jgi:hypothetical protein